MLGERRWFIDISEAFRHIMNVGRGNPLADDGITRARASRTAPAARRSSRDDFQRAAVERTGEDVVLTPLSGQESHMIVRAAAADVLVHIPRGEGELPAGSRVRYLPLDGSAGA